MGNRIIGYKNKLWRVIHDFHCTESDQPFTLNKGTYLFICKGGAGGYSRGGTEWRMKPYGGVSYGVLTLNEDNNEFHAVVGGNGADTVVGNPSEHQLVDQRGGFNGGSNGGEPATTSYAAGCGGGGATDIRLLEYDPNEYPTYDNEGRFVEPANPYTTIEVDNLFDIDKFRQWCSNYIEYLGNGEWHTTSDSCPSYCYSNSGSNAKSTANMVFSNIIPGHVYRIRYMYKQHRSNSSYHVGFYFQFVYTDGTMGAGSINPEHAEDDDIWMECVVDSDPTKTLYGINTKYNYYGYMWFKDIEVIDVTAVDETTKNVFKQIEYIQPSNGYTQNGNYNSNNVQAGCLTDYIPNENTRVEFDCVVFKRVFPNDEWMALFDGRVNSRTQEFGFFARNGNSSISDRFIPFARIGDKEFYYDTTSDPSVNKPLPYHQRITVKMDINKVEWYVQDERYGSIQFDDWEGNYPTFVRPLGVLICAGQSSSVLDYFRDTFCGQFFGMKIYENDVLVRDYVPCLDATNQFYIVDRTNHGYPIALRQNNSSWPLFVKSGQKVRSHPSMDSRIMVAGGGGGDSAISNSDGGIWSGQSFGGGSYGGPCNEQVTYRSGNGWLLANQSYGYSLGYGIHPIKATSSGTWSYEGSGGAGGGWYSGFTTRSTYATSYNIYCGGGGSGYIYTSNSFKPPGYNPPSKYQFTDTFMCACQSDEGEAIICEEISPSQLKSEDIIEFPCVGESTSFNLMPGKYRLTCYGADGGYLRAPNQSSRGGLSQGVVTIPQPTQTYVNVGGTGYLWNNMNPYGDYTGNSDIIHTHSHAMTMMPILAFNGGGTPNPNVNTVLYSAGGGATDIRFNGNTLYHRAIVAAGGGGTGYHQSWNTTYVGSNGGGEQSGNRSAPSTYASDSGYVNNPSTQTQAPTTGPYDTTVRTYIAGSFGQGGSGRRYSDGRPYSAASGGGGWFGGSGCEAVWSGSGGGLGGSSYLLTENSYKPEGYQLDSKYYLSEAYTTTGGNPLPRYLSGATIEVLEAYKNVLAKDSDGYKYFDNTQNAWTLISPQPNKLTPSLFETYAESFFVSDTGLQTNYKLYILDEDESVEKLALSITPNVVRIKAHTEMTADVLSESIDVDPYDETVFNYNIYTRKELIDGENKVQVYVDIEKLVQGDQKFKLYSASLTGKGGSSPQSSYRYMSLEDVTPTLDCDPDNPCYGTLVRPNGEMDDHRDDHGNIKVDQYLLPLKIGGTKNIPQEYVDGLFESGTTTITSTMSYVYNRLIYLCSTVRFNNTNYVEISTYNFNTKQFSRLYRLPWYPNFDSYNNEVNSMTICGFLVDDKNFYINARGYRTDYSSKYLCVMNRSTGNITRISTPSGVMFTGGFKRMNWYDESHQHIIGGDDNSNSSKLFIINAASYEIETIQFSSWLNGDSIYGICDICCTDKTVAVAYINNSNYRWKLCLHDKVNNTSTLFDFDSNAAYTCESVTYHDGKFYVAIRGGLRIIDEETKTQIGSVSIPWGTHYNNGNGACGPIEYCNGALFVPEPETNWLFIYDLNKQTYNMLYLNWRIDWRNNGTNYYANHTSCSFNQLYFFPGGSTMLVIDYLGGVKYNIGYKYNQYQVDYTTDNDELEYDPSCVTMTESCAIISDGLKQYVLNPYDEDHIASIDVSKNDYRYAYGMTPIHYEPEPEPEEDNNEGDE